MISLARRAIFPVGERRAIIACRQATSQAFLLDKFKLQSNIVAESPCATASQAYV
jgi:hypothetical protein